MKSHTEYLVFETKKRREMVHIFDKAEYKGLTVSRDKLLNDCRTEYSRLHGNHISSHHHDQRVHPAWR
jgi:hypothetical protein